LPGDEWPAEPSIKGATKVGVARELVFGFMCWLVAQQAIHAAADADLTKKTKLFGGGERSDS